MAYGMIIEDDMDELQEALEVADITQQQFELAIETSNRLQKGLLNDKDLFKAYIQKLYELAK